MPNTFLHNMYDSLDNPMMSELLTPFDRRDSGGSEGGSERLGHSPKVTQPR